MDYYCDNNWPLDLKLVIRNKGQEDKVLYTCSKAMTAWSPVFVEKLAEKAFKEGESMELTLEDKKYDDIQEMYKFLHPCEKKKQIPLDKAYQLLPLFHEYKIQKKVNECEAAIMKDKRTNIPELFTLAVKYGLGELKDQCMMHYASYRHLAQIESDKKLTAACKIEIMEKKIEIMEDAVYKESASFQEAVESNTLKYCGEHSKDILIRRRCPLCESASLQEFLYRAFKQ